MFKRLGLIIGGVCAIHYFSLIPEVFYDFTPKVDEKVDKIIETAASVSANIDEFGTHAINTIAQGKAVAESTVEEIISQQSKPVVQPTEQPIEQLTEQQIQNESLQSKLLQLTQQFAIWQPFSNHYSAQGMAQSLMASTGVTVNVVQQGNDYVLMVTYQSEVERLLLIERLSAVLGHELDHDLSNDLSKELGNEVAL